MDISIIDFLTAPLFLAQDMGQGTGATDEKDSWIPLITNIGIVLAIFVLPFVVSHFVAKAVRMPDHAFKLGVMIAAVTAGLLFAWKNDFQLLLGPDMKGGTTLVYDIIETEGDIDAGALATALGDRLNPSGTQEISIRKRGESQIEITVPNVDEYELKRIKDIIGKAGQLQFEILANGTDHRDVIEQARIQANTNKSDVIMASDKKSELGRWVTVGRESTKVEGINPLKILVSGTILRNSVTGELLTPPPGLDGKYGLEKWMDANGIRDVDVLMSYGIAGTPYAVVSGDDLASAQTRFGNSGYEVDFRLNPAGAKKMLDLTVANQPRPDGSKRRMAIIMDDRVLSAPNLNSPISNQGVIQGNFKREEVEYLVTILRAGRLPATLGEEPASESRVGAGLGATTISKGTNASIWAIVTTFACILVYYRFSGVVASLALLINGILIFGIMIFISQPLTLPGLAGLVLTIGMSVDANVLIFERIREEKAKGSAPRMSIRNGFDRAFTTIIDANLTTLIAAIVLYWIGTDQVRGFAVALVIGILTSMFTATFCSRIVFEIAEKLKMVSLSMSDGVGFLKKSFLGDRDINFMNWRKICFILSLVVIVGGLGGVAMRGRQLLNIDFTGGTSVTFQLTKGLPADKVREITGRILKAADTAENKVESKLVNVEKGKKDTVYTLVTSIESQERLSQLLTEGFAAEPETDLKTYKIDVTRDDVSSNEDFLNQRVRYVSMQAADTPAQEGTSEEAKKPEAEASEGQEGTEPETAPASDPAPGTQEPTAEVATDPADTAPATTDGDETTGTEEGPAEPVAPAPVEFTKLTLALAGSTDSAEDSDEDKGARIAGASLQEELIKAAQAANITMNKNAITLEPAKMPEDGWTMDDVKGFSEWKVVLPVGQADADVIVRQLQSDLEKQPLWLSLDSIGGKVAGEMQQRAIAAILISLIFIVAYIWFRFQKVAYGLAAVVALVHDVLITLGILALCHWLAGPLGFLLIEDFKIGLTEIAAFLTIIGYSLNDTIVVFDRIREVRGRSPKLSGDMINDSVNQTLSRTLLTSGTTLVTVLLLYVFGGEGIHAFAFALLIGVLVGTYSSVFIAAPVLLWISNREKSPSKMRAANS